MLAKKKTKQRISKIFASIVNKTNNNQNKNFWKFNNWINKDNKKEAEILLYGVIGEDGYWDDVTSKQFAEDLKAVEDAVKINVRINSPGGDVFAGQAIYSMLKRCKSEVIVYIDGLAASIASIVAMSGDKIIMPKNAMMMIHKPWTITAGNANDMREEADTLDKIEESIISVYTDKTGLSAEEIKTLLEDETWLTASDALEKGFIDEIEETEVKAQIINDSLEINGQTFNIKNYKKFNSSWYKKGDKGADVGEDEADENVPKSNKNSNSVKNSKNTKGKTNMNLKARCLNLGLDYDALVSAGMTDEAIKAMCDKVENSNNAASESKADKERVSAIIKLGEEYNAKDKALQFIKDNKTVDQFKDELLKANNNNNQNPIKNDFGVGLTVEEAQSFSFTNLINALANPSDRDAQKAAENEFKMCEKAAEKYGAKNKGLVIPVEALLVSRPKNDASTNVDTTNAGALVRTTLKTDSFIEMLRKKCVILQLARQLNGLVGNIDIPKQTAGTSGYWVGEDEAPTKTNAAFGTLQLRMKTVGANSYITRTMLKQSSMDIEQLVREDLAAALALKIDEAAFYGTGSSNQPKGLKNITGINSKEFNADYPTFGELVDMETEISKDNADVEDMAYVVAPTARGHFKQTLKFPTSTNAGGTIWEQGNNINGYKAVVTNVITDGDVFMGNFADYIVGLFGGLELLVDPYTYSNKGAIQITAFQDVDYGARHEESFCYGKKKVTQGT